MTEIPKPRRAADGQPQDGANADAPEVASGASPSRAFEDDDPTAVRGGFDFDLYRSEPEASAPDPEPGPQPQPSPWSLRERLDDDAPAPRSTGGGRYARPAPPKAERGPSLRRSILLTLASTVLPGSGLLGSRRRWQQVLGATTALLALAGATILIASGLTRTGDVAALAGNLGVLRGVTATLIAGGLVWVTLITMTHLATRPRGLRTGRRLIGALVVTALSFSVAVPSAIAARYSRDQQLLVEKVFKGEEEEVQSSTRPTLEGPDPWAGIPRVNILLLGADGDASRKENVEKYSVRTDTIIVASIDTATGATTLVQVPRNVQFTPFPEGSELAEAFPDGFRGQPEGDWYVNSVWAKVELDYPNLLAGSTYRGAEGTKLAVEGITGLKVDYFVMLNIDGLQKLIDAMGGVTVNINDRLAIGGDSTGRRPHGYLEVGPNQHLDGYHAMWYARSRLGYSDYERMARQSCLVDAVIKQANPTTLLTRFEAIASASGDMLLTDIPQRDLDDIIKLAFRVKDAKVSRLVFSQGKNGYWYDRPDFEAMHEAVQNAIEPKAAPSPSATSTAPGSTVPSSPRPTPSASSSASSSTPDPLAEGTQDVGDACAFNAG